MKMLKTIIEGVYLIENFYIDDDRGSFIKTFHDKSFREGGLCFECRESYFSVSNKDVIRGMHFQLPPHDHDKLVYVPYGEVEDVILDLRKTSKTYGEFTGLKLNSENHLSVFIPKGLAHGFKSNYNHSIVVYNVSTEYDRECDYGVRYDSFGYAWGVSNPILSDRDKALPDYETFIKKNPF